jgi:prephenate dehydratase
MVNKVAVLGPEYSYSHILAMKVNVGEIVLCNTIPEIFEKVSKGIVDSGIAPIENMAHGTVRESLIGLHKYKVKINKEMDFPIHLCLAAKNDKFSKIISKQEALSQTSNFIGNYKDKKTEDTSSTSLAMKIASENEDYAAIGSEEAAKSFKLNIIAKNIENNKDNVTRFIIISKEESADLSKSTRSSMLILPSKDRPGLLHDILSLFKENNINLTKIESIPTGKKIGEYEFFIEIDGNILDSKIKEVLEKLNKEYKVFFFGSYSFDKLN